MKKQKQEKSEIDYLKKINNTLGSIFTILVLLAIFITIAGVVSIEINRNVAAEAAEENLLRSPATAESANDETETIVKLDYSLGLEAGKKYRISGTLGTSIVLDSVGEYKDQGNGMYQLIGYYPDEETAHCAFIIFDKVSYDEAFEPVPDDNSAVIMFSLSNAEYAPAIINSITLVEETSGGNLLSAPITQSEPIDDTAVINLDYSVGIEDGKTYTFKGTHGTNNTPFEVTILADKANGGDFAGMLTDERQGLIVAKIRNAEGAGLDIVLLDKIHLDFENEISEYNENKATLLLVTYSSAEQIIPLTINSITEYVEEQQVEAPQIIGNITNSFTGFLTGTGEGIVNFFEVVFSDGNGGISTLGIVGLSMMGLGLAVGIISVLMAKAKM